MQLVIDIVSLGRAARNECQIKIRQPLAAMYLPESTREVVEKMFGLIQEEVNIHKVVYIADDDDFVHYELKPQFKVMGPKYGAKMQQISKSLASVKAQNILRAFASIGSFRLRLVEEEITLVPEDIAVGIKPREGYVFQSIGSLFVALDTQLSAELVSEGYARELINKIQFSRKEQGFEIMDNISVFWAADHDIAKAFAQYGDRIMSETLCRNLSQVEPNPEAMGLFDINGKEVLLRIVKLV